MKKKLLLHEIMLGEKIYEIKAIKVKRMKDFYNSYLALKKDGLIKMLNKEGGEGLLDVFLKGVFDVPNVEGELLENLNEYLNENLMKKIIKITERINEIKE